MSTKSPKAEARSGLPCAALAAYRGYQPKARKASHQRDNERTVGCLDPPQAASTLNDPAKGRPLGNGVTVAQQILILLV